MESVGTPVQFNFVREFDAPREIVFKAWTDPVALAQWWGPKGITAHVAKWELRPGGIFLYSMDPPAESKMSRFWGRFIFSEIDPPKRLVYVNAFSDEHGGITRNPWDAGWPLESLITVTFEEAGKKTKMSVASTPINATPEEVKVFEAGIPSMTGGYGSMFERLAEHLSQR